MLSEDTTAKEGVLFPANGQVTTFGSPSFSSARYIDGISETEQLPCHGEATSLRIRANFPRDIE